MPQNNPWFQHPMLKDLAPQKKALFEKISREMTGKTGKAVAPVLLSTITLARKQNIRFSEEEMKLIIELIKEGKSKQEQKQIDDTIRMASAFLQRHN